MKEKIFITSNTGQVIEITDLSGAIQQVKKYLRMLKREKKFVEINKPDQAYFNDILNKLLDLLTKQEQKNEL